MTTSQLRVGGVVWIALAAVGAYAPAAIGGVAGALAGLVLPVITLFVTLGRFFELAPPFTLGTAIVLTLTYWSLATLFTFWVGLSFSSTVELVLILILGAASAAPLLYRQPEPVAA